MGDPGSSHKTATVPPAAPERNQKKGPEKKGPESKRAACKKNLNFNCEGRNAFQNWHTGGDTIFHAHKWKQCTDEGVEGSEGGGGEGGGVRSCVC